MAPHAFVRRVFACALALAGLLPLVAAAAPAITSATYDAGTGVLVVTGTDIPSLAGSGNDIVANKFTFTGDGGSTYTLTDTANVDIDSATGFTLTLGAADRAAVNQRLNRQGTSSTIGTTYNLGAAEDWAAGADPAEVVADTTGNGITVSNVPVPQVTSASYNAATGSLTVSGTDFLPLIGAGNDMVARRFTVRGAGGGTYTLADTADVDITSATRFTLVLSASDKTGVDAFIDRNGTSSAGGQTYNLAAAEDWNAGVDGPVSILDTTGNGITASNVNVAPVVTTSGGSAAFVAGDNTASTPVAVDGGLSVSDANSATLASATVAITGGFRAGEDVLAHTNDGSTMGNIAASYNAATGVLILTSASATATLVQWQSALRSVTYRDTAVTPDTATRTVAFRAVDGGGRASTAATRTVTVTAVNQTPIVTTTGATTSYGSGAPAVVIDGGTTVSDLDNATQSAATVAIGSGFRSGDILAFASAGSFGNIAGSYNAATGVLTLTSAGATATNAQWGNALSSVTFSSTSITGGNRTIGFSISDGDKTSDVATASIAMLAPPVVTSVGSASADGNYGLGDTITLTVTFDQTVVVNTAGGTPGLLLETGGVDRIAEYGSGSGSRTLSFTYAVQAGDASPDLDYASTTALALNGGTIRSAGGGDADPTLPATGGVTSIAGQHAIVVDSAAPVVSSVDVPANGVYLEGDHLDFTVRFGEGITVDTSGGTPSIDVALSSGTVQAQYVSGSGTDALLFRYAVTRGDLDRDGIAVGSAIDANGGRLRDDAGNDAGSALNHVAATTSVLVGPGGQAITFGAQPAQAFVSDSTFALDPAATASSGLPVSYSSQTTDVCTIEGSTMTMVSAGTCTIAADQAGNADYSAAPTVLRSIEIARATPTLAWIEALQKVIGQPAFELPEPDSDSSGGFTFSSSDPAVATVAGRTVTLVGAGTTTLLVTQEQTGDYTKASISTTLTVTARPDPTRDPEVVGSIQAQVDASVRFAAAQQSNIQGRLRQLRAGGGNPSSNGLALSYVGRGGGMNLPLGTEASTRRLLPAGAWTAGTITIGRRDPGNDLGELDFRSEGLTVGYDHGFGENALVGVAGGYGWSDSDTGATSTLDGRQRSLMAYGLWRSERHGFVDGVLGIGSLDFDIVRWSEAVGTHAQARRNGDQVFGSLTYGYEHTGEHLTLTSYGRYDTSRTELDAYAESGLGLYDLSYGRQTVEDSGLAVGIEGRHHFATASVGYRPYWLVEYRNGLKNRSDLDINYVLYPVANDYVLGLQGSFDDVLSIGAGFDVDLPRGWQLSLLFQREQAGDNRADTYGLQLGWTSPGR
ncbi:MAG: autotransporter domain-containing protein [Lysobacter sp.]